MRGLGKYIRDIVKHMNGYFSKKQFGFISGRSTILQLLHVLDRWSEILDEAGAVDSIDFDIAKAFDTVRHAHLISKLHMCNISPIVID